MDEHNADAEAELSTFYTNGFARLPHDDRKAVDLFQKAADQRNEIAEYLLATAYAKDQSLPQEPEKAFMWAKKSAD